MQKREKVLSIIAVVSAIFFVVNQFVCAEKTPPAKKASAAAPKVTAKPASKPQIRGEIISNAELEKRLQNWQPLVTYETWGRNPFRGAIEFYADSLRDTVDLRLKGIAWKGRQALVLIGDRIMRPGERDGDLELLKVYHDRVIARRKGELLTLYLEPENHQYEKNKIHHVPTSIQ